MAEWVFAGRVYPERAAVEVRASALSVTLSDGTEYTLELRISAPELYARVAGPDTKHVLTLRNHVAEISSRTTDALGWTLGRGYTVEIISCLLPDGTSTHFDDDVPIQPETLVDDVLAITVGSRGSPNFEAQEYLRHALANYRLAILQPADTFFYCARAVESLRNYFGDKEKAAWAELRRRLRLDEDWLKKNVSKPARPIRHGRPLSVTQLDREIALRCSSLVIERFVALIGQGVDELPADTHPTVN